MTNRLILLASLLFAGGCGATSTSEPSSTVTNSRRLDELDNNRELHNNSQDRISADKFPTLDWITISTTGWELTFDGRKSRSWTDKHGDTLLLAIFSRPEIEGNGLPEGFPNLATGANELRNYRRRVAQEHESGLVQADIKQLDGNVLAGISITKQRQEPNGFEFSGSCVIPRREFSFLIIISASERGTTGIREAFVTKELIESGELEVELPEGGKPGRLVGFIKDPYDSRFDDGALYNLSDQKKYDHKFPQHPLTRLRSKFKNVIDSIEFSSDVVSSPPYTVSGG